MANIYQLWDNTVLNSANATPEQLEQKRNELKTRFESIAREKGVASKDIYATIDKFDQYSRQKTTTRDDGLTPDEREAAQDDGSTILGLNKGGLKAGARGAGDALLGIASSVPRVVGDLAQTWSDVGDNDPSELSAQLARKAYDASEDIKSNYSEGTKKAKKDFWSPAGLAMGIGENIGQIALSGGLVGAAGKGAMLASKGSKAWGLGAAATTGMGLAYGQGYGQGKENALEKINRTSNEDLYAGVVNQFNEWNSGGAKKGSKPEIVSLYEEAEGDLNKMKDLMAEDAGAWAGILTAVTAPIAMGATAFMNRGAINEMAKQGAGNIITRNLAAQTGARDAAEFSRRVATGAGVGSIAGQGLKIAGNQIGRQALEEGIQEGGEGYLAAQAGSLARGDKGVLNNDDWSEVGQQAAQGAAIGGLIGGGGSLLTMRDAQNTGIAQAKARTELPKQYQDAFNAFEDAKQAEAQAQAAHEANPTPESEEILAAATSERLKANNQFNQYDAAFKQSFTEQEQKDLLANDLKGIAARAKLAEEAKQAELNNKAQQEALVKAQRDNLVKGLAAFVGNEEVLLNEVNQLGLDDTQKELLLNDVFAERKKTKTNPQHPNGQTKTPLELAIDEHFDAKGNRKPSAVSPDIAAKHKVTLSELVPAIAKRMNDIKIQKAQAEKQAKVDAFNKTREQESTQDVKREKLTEKQQLENTLAEFAAENDTDSMLALLDGYENKAEADKLFNNAFKTVETRAKEAEKATKAKEAETAKQEQAKQKQSAFSTDMSALYESNPNATYNDWKAIGKKYGVTSAIDLASAWAKARTNKPKQKDEQKPENTETLALPAPDTVMVADAQGNVIPTTENNVPKKPRSNDFSVPSGLKVDVSNVENTRSDLGKGSYIGSAMIVRQDGQPFPTEQVAQQALKNKASKPRKPKEKPVTPETHEVVPVDGGYAIAPVESDIKNIALNGVIAGNFLSGNRDEVEDLIKSLGITDEELNSLKPDIKDNYLDRDYEYLPTANTVGLGKSNQRVIYMPKTKGKNGHWEIIENDYVLAIDNSRFIDLPKISREQALEISNKNGVNVYYDVVPRAYAEHMGYKPVPDSMNLDGDWVKQDKPVTAESSHIDNGKIEEVTGEVIRESLAKVDDKPIGGKTINLKEAKQWLLDRANKALNEATIDDISKALRNEFDYSSGMIGNSESASERERKRLAKNKLVYEKLDKEIGYVTFDVPNDGSFRVLKTKKSLERFIKQVQSNKGFTETKKQSSSSDVAGQSPESVIKDFFSDRELDNAYEYSKLKGKPMRFGKPYEDKIPAYALTESFDVHGVEFFVGLSTEKEKTGANTYGYKWRVIEPKTGFAIGASQNTKKEAVDEAKKQLTKHVVDTNIEAAIAREVDSTIYVSESQREQKWLASIGHVTEDNVSAQKPQNINKKSAAIENLYDLALGAAKATQIKADRDKNKPVDFAANTFEDKWQKAINGDAKAIKDIRDYFVNNKRVPNMTKAHLIIFEGLTNQDFTSKTYEYVASKFDEYINGFSDVNTNNSSTQKFMPTFDDVMTHLKGIHNLSAESFKDAQTKAVIKNTLEGYLDKVMPNDVSAKDFKAITDKFFNELVSSYPQTEHQSSGMLAHPIPEIAKQTNQPTKKESLLIKIDDELDSALDDLAAIFKEQGKRLSSGVDPVIMGKVLAIGMKASTLYLAKGAVKFAVWAENMIASLSSKGVAQDLVEPYLKGLYAASKMQVSPEIRQQMDKEDDVYDFDFAILNQAEDETNKLGSDKLVFKNIDELKKWAAFNANNKKTPISFQRIVGVDDSVYYFKNKQEWENDISENTSLVFVNENQIKLKDTQNVTTPSQTSRDNVGERNQTPESSQVQRASKSKPAQGDTQQRDDGVSANSGGREVTGDRGNNNSGQSSVRGNANGKSTGNQSSVLPSGTRSTESSDGTNLRNYRIQPNELKRTGSWRATAEQNVQIVELVKTIIAENRAATPEEKTLLTKFTGWGASEIANGIFPNQYGSYKDANWKALGERLEAALTPEEYDQAKRTTQYAHYTSEPIIRSVYAALSRFGFNGGSMVEPGMGVGLFNGLMPDAMANNSQYTGIEYDTITGNIAKLLYPDSNIIVGDFTQTKLPKNFFDVAIGNPPFGSIKIQSDPEYKKQGFLLHDYFFAKTIDRVKDGGLLVFVTSKGTMDKTNDRARKYLSDRADLVGAIRLPQTAFKDNAGTEVVTDVIFLRKRMAGEEPAGEAWAGLKEITTPQGAASINEYFATHPEMILGKSALTGSMYRANEYTVEPIAGSDIETLFSEAINNLPENIYTPQRGSKAEQAAVQRRDYDPKIKKEGGIYVADDGVLMQVNNGQGTPLTQKQNSKHELVDLSPKEMQWLKDYVGVRDALKQAQYDQLQDNPNWQQSLETLNKTYDAFVKKHGFIEQHTVSERENEDGSTTVTKRFKNHGLLFLDAEGALARTLEDINPDNSISKAPALLGRVINKPSTPVITSTQDAMFVVFNELGRFDLAKVAKLINKSEKDVVAELGDSIYQDPSTSWTTADDYLSGNVVRKLKEAEQAARLNPKYQRNVAALKAVQPPALAPQDINVQLGAAWIPASDIGLFASEVLGEQRFKVGYSPLTGQWSVEGGANYSSEWGIPAKNSQDILEAVLNNRQIKVTYTDANKKTHTDTEKTEKANDIAKKMRESFKRWLWQDVPRTERLVTYYNEHFNNIAPRSFDGQHLTLPGVSSRFDLRPHQKRAIWRTIQQGDVYYAHAVGAGKTFTMIASGMEERRLGLVKKPMYVVPNHMLAQFSKEFLELYPMANIMVADEANFHTHNRRKFVAQAALNNPDAIVITHSAFGRIGMSSDYSYKFIKNQIADWQEALQEVGNDERITRKQIERRIEQLENKLKALLDGEKDQLLNFEELGVDRLYVDEGHEFRKLDFPTNRGNIKGIDPSGSQKSMDLYMKVEYLRSKNPNRSLVMASGTPVTNTMGELFTVQRFFNPSQLEEDGDSRFDAWSAHYGEVVDGLEQNAAGGYETVSRFAKFVNVPELMSRVRYFMDILTSNQLGDLVQRPDVVGGGRQVIVTPAPDGYKEYQKDLERRIKAIRDRKAPPKAGDDIILSVIGDGRFSAIDMRFVDSTLPSDPNSKLNRMLDDLISAYHETANNEYVTSGVIDPNKGSSLMLFTDIGLGEQSAKNRGFDMKAWIEQRLLEGGVKREHIAFMRDNKAHSQKEKLFDDMRQGKKRILIGGKDMETGVNAQKRLTHLFHLDAPWFPASVEQREGRIIRQGNQNKIVAIRAYASKGSYDSTMWGMNSRKARFIEQAMSGDSSIRNMEDVSEASAFEMAAALASGDERYLKLAGLKGDVERLSRLYSAHIDEQKRFSREKAHLESQNKHSTSKIEQINEAIAKRKPIKAGEFLANVGKQSFDSREDFSKALFEKFKEVAESYKADEVELGSVAGFPIVYNGVELRGGNFAADLRVELPIDAEPLAIFPIDPAYSVSGIATRAVNQTNALDRELVSRKSSIEQNTKDLARIGRRIGASFPEMAELNEKQQALNELEQELNSEGMTDDDLSQTDNQDSDSKPKFSQSSTIGDRTITQVRDKLISRFGKRIVELLESKGILKIHQSMSDKDIPAEALRQLAFHGSPHKFDKFSLEHLGSGEGAQVYGWGLYFASKKAVSEWYRKNISEQKNRTKTNVELNGRNYDFTEQGGNDGFSLLAALKNAGFKNRDAMAAIMELRKHNGLTDAKAVYQRIMAGYNPNNEPESLRDNYEKTYNQPKTILEILESFTENTGQLYEVNIPEDDTMLLWDRPLSESPKFVIDALKKAKLVQPYEIEEMTGEEFYEDLYAEAGSRLGIKASDEAASKLLNSLGISGIKYLDGTSRFAGDGSYNYVVFDDSAVEVLKTYYSAQQGVTEGFYLNGTVHLIADNLTDETIIPTFVHELGGHKGFQEMMSPKAYELIMQQFDRLVAQGNPIAVAAKKRAQQAEDSQDRQTDEYIPYLLTEQEKAQLATPQERNAVKRLIDHIVRAVKGWVVRTLSKYNATAGIGKRVSETLDARDIQLMAERMIRDIAKRGGDNNNSPKFSKTEQSQFDQLLAKADKMIAEQGKLLAPNGKPSKLNRYQWAQVRTDNFKAWFGNWENDPENASKVVDENGEPMVVYHGTRADFNTFAGRQSWQALYNEEIGTSYFTSDKEMAIGYSGGREPKSVYLSFKTPYSYDANGETYISANFNSLTKAKSNGFDSVLIENVEDTSAGQEERLINTYISFAPTQIKSAISNNGEFSPTNPDIRFSRAEDKAKAAKDYVLDSVRIKRQVAENLHAKAELGWWSKTIGTQLNTAKKFKDFDRVYKLLQRLLQHQSSDVMDALEVAPTLLEKLDDWKDFKNQAKSIGRNISQGVKHKLTNAITDRMAVAKVIFGETLAKKPLSQTELEQKLNTQQLKLYEEARAAINVSLKNTAKSEIIRSLLQADAINFDTVEKHLNQQTGFDEFVDEMLENVGARISNAQAELSQATDKVQKEAIKEEIARLSDMYNSISNVNNKVYQLIDEAYAPLMRFGDYALTMRDKTTGKVLSFMMFESKAERNRMVNYLGTEYGNTVDLETDTMSTEDFKQFKGVTPETVALFAKELGLDKNEAYQGYLKLAIPATSALTRRIQRKGTAGFNEDIQRVLASFVMSNARYSAKNIYLAKADREISEIESGASVRDQAKKMRDNTIDPVDTFAWLRDLLFVWNLGGSVMFAFLNMTQPFMQTIPMLSQYVNTGFATKHVLRGIGVAGKAMATGNAPKGYEAEYKRAVHEGIVDPQNTFMLTGLERGGTGTTSKVRTGAKHILGLFAQMSESLNRKAVFIASLEVANAKGGAWLKQKGYASAYDFAVDVISQTQGVYNKANRSNWAHNPVGAPLLVFKQFSINYVEQMVRMAKNNTEGEEGKKAVLLMLFMLFSLAGGMGLPFIKDIFDLSETTAAFFGNPINIEREMRLMGKEYFGETTTGALMDGWLNKLVIGEVLGADVQSRTGMGDLIPMTNVFNPVLSDSQRVNEAASIFGAAGGLGEKAGDSIQFAANDEWGNALINILPRFATSMVRGIEMMTTGETTDSKGRKLFDVTIGEGLVKFADSQPVRMAELSRARGLEYDDIAIQRSKIEYYKKKWVKAAQKEDMEAIEQIEQDIQEWNENNEKYPVIFDRKRAYQTANKNDMTWGEREAKPPRGMDWMKNERPEM